MTAFAALLQELFERRTAGIRFGLERVRAVLDAWGRPHEAYGVVHVAGTNGKGSCAAMIESILRAGGARTALYTSPHLSRFTERYRIGGVEADADALAPYLERALAAPGPLTFFEIATVAALALFRDAGVELAVLEAGLGGRLDATNVVDAPLCAVVTSVARDHEALLGATLEAIADEKIAICKPGRPAVLSARDPAILERLAAGARGRGAAPVLRLPGDLEPWPGPLPLAGAHQARNAALAVAAARAARPGLDDATIARGLAGTRWPGRLERVGDVLFDVAHNVEGAQALAAALAAEPARPRVLVFGAAADKDAAGMLAALRPVVEELLVTRGRNERFAEPAAIARFAPGAAVIEPAGRALDAARHRGGLAVVAGSCLLVGELRAWLLGEREDPVAVQDPSAAPR